HIEPMSLPGKEAMPRHAGGNFYWSQEDLVIERAATNGWSYSVMRPQIVCGASLGSPMNMVMAIGVYLCVMKALAQPCGFPGRSGFVTEATDAGLLARAILWAGQTPECAGQTFNITNGDILHWPSLWPALTALFGLPADEPVHRSLADEMPQHAAVWDGLVAQQNLQPYSMNAIVGSSWQFADAVFGYAGVATTLLSTIKARQFGFAECLDTQIMFQNQIEHLQQMRILPR
ncbi:MAG: hypothetical protein O3A63_17965, partial [Proteobacteria bacterium]|nr:hypothetical protein [Pseudomonadota bacterium]